LIAEAKWMKASQKGRITRISRIKGTDYTEHGGGIERQETLSMRREFVFSKLRSDCFLSV
jgi:hypothetical protein